MGLGTQMIAWHEDFCSELAARGLSRGALRQPRHRALDPRAPGARRRSAQLLTRSRRAARYTLADMAEDAPTLLRELELGPAHVIGASMGGMIAQTLAARHARTVRSLVSIMSSTGSLRAGQPSPRIYPLLLRRAPREREAFIEHMVRVFAAIGSTGPAARRAGDPHARRDQLRPRPRPRRARAPARRDHRLRRPHDRTAPHHRADARDPRHRRPARRALGRARDRARDPARRS